MIFDQENLPVFSYKKHFDKDEMHRMEKIADQIRISIIGEKGAIMDEYIQKAQEISLFFLGIDNVNEIVENDDLESFFPDSVWKILKQRCLDEEFKNIEPVEPIKLHIELEKEKEKHEISIDNKIKKKTNKENKYDEKTMNFIKSNADKGCRWIADQLGYTYDAIQKKCKREKIELAKILK